MWAATVNTFSMRDLFPDEPGPIRIRIPMNYTILWLGYSLLLVTVELAGHNMPIIHIF